MKFLTTAEDIQSADFASGTLLLVDKPIGWTSFDVVHKLRGPVSRICGVKRLKVGHAGTLDPMATGLLLICTGKWTRRLGELQGLDKSYEGCMQLGGVTASYDAETPVTDRKPVDGISQEDVERVAAVFVGEIQQVPPVYSAIKVQGKPMYRLARQGTDIIPEARTVWIRSLQITEVHLPSVYFRVECSKGTYIRSLAHDIGQRLSCGAFLSELRRTAVGPFKLGDAWTLPGLVAELTTRSERMKTKTH